MEPRSETLQAGAQALISQRSAGAEVEVKTEASWNVISATDSRQVIYLSSDSEGDSSESDTCSNTSGEADAMDLEPDRDAVDQLTYAIEQKGHFVWARNSKTRIVHECRSEMHVRLDDQEAFKAIMVGTATSCGRITTDSYKLVSGPCDWTAKCRVCFKGRRAPTSK